jgi:putative salt-induced outer membrane protein YdiY
MRRTVLFTAAALVCFWAGSVVTAQDEEELGWADEAELSFVATDGNSETETIGFKNTLTRRWEKALFELKAMGIRAESTTRDPIAIGTASSFSVDDQKSTDTTAETYALNGRYNKKISENFFWYVGAGWDRNRDAGIDNRYTASGGVGNIWINSEDVLFATDYALTYTDQEDVVEDPDASDSFAGARFSWRYENKLTESTTYKNDLIVDANLDETDDYRADMVNSVSVAINKRLALKVGLQVLYDNMPALEEVPLFLTAGGAQTGTVLVELDDVDTIFRTSLVVNF